MNGLYSLGRRKSSWDIEKPLSLSAYSPDITERSKFQFSDIEPNIEPDMAPITPEIKTLATGITPEAKKTTGLMDYWKQPVFGKIPLDQFVRLAGMLGHAIAPETPMGRAGGVLGQMGGEAYAGRMKAEEEERKYQREEPKRLLKGRYYEAQIKKLGELKEPKIPTTWEAFYPDYMKRFPGASVGEAVKAFKEAEALPKEPKEDKIVTITMTDPATGETHEYQMLQSQAVKFLKGTPSIMPGEIREKDLPLGKVEEGTLKIPPEVRRPPETAIKGKKITEKTPYVIGKREKFISKDGKEYEGTYLGLDDKNEPKWGNIAKIAEKPTEEKVVRENKWLTNFGKRYAVTNIYGESLLTEESAGAAWGDFKKQIPTLQKQGYDIDYLTTQMRSLYGEETVKPGTSPRVFEDIKYKGSEAEGKIVPGPAQKIFKDKQGREMIKDPTSNTGWRYR